MGYPVNWSTPWPPPAAPNWKGYLKLSLVTCPIALYPASSEAEKTHFHQINRKTGRRLRQQMVDEVSGKVVNKEDKSRGYEVSKGKYVEIEPEEIKAIQVESSHTLRCRGSWRRSQRATPSAAVNTLYLELWTLTKQFNALLGRFAEMLCTEKMPRRNRFNFEDVPVRQEQADVEYGGDPLPCY